MTLKLKKGAIIDIKCKDYIESLERPKVLITSDPILIYPDFSKPFSLTTDASNVAMCYHRITSQFVGPVER